MKTYAIVMLTVLGVVCGCKPPPSTPSGISASKTIQRVFQTDLPASATNLNVFSTSLMTMVVRGRFECTPDDLLKFLTGSALVPDQLQSGRNPLAPMQQSDLSWWKPASLQGVSGVECDWEAGAEVASCQLVAGRSGKINTMTVYFMVVYENKQATSLRPKVKADPNWGRATNGIPSKAEVGNGK